MIKTVDLFSGCGGLSLGFERAGFQVIAAYDNWEPAVKVYRDNFSHPIYTDDLSDENVQNKIAEMHPDVIIGGPPCQDYSSAGHRDITLGRAALTLSYRDIIIKARPKYFLMENVPEIRKYRILADIIQDFKNAGYGLTQRILEASYYGVPQARKRFILIGGLNEPDDFLGVAIDRRASDHAMTMRDYFGDSLGVDYYFRVPRSYSRRGIFSIDEPCQTIRGVDRPIPPGYPVHPSDPVPLGPNVRALTVKERSMVQTFPETFKFSGNKTDQNQMIGNAVPVNLAKAVADALYEHIVNKNGPSLKGVDLFAGCGGMTLGFEKAGVDILAGYDNWKPACDIYSANFSHSIISMDLFKQDAIDSIKQFKPQIIIGGPPCQDFSIAGPRNQGKRANLTIRYAEIVSQLKPEWFVMENVYNIERMPVLPKALQIFKDAGYGVTTKVLDASLCGVPQTRKRFFAIGHLNDEDGFLTKILEENLSDHRMTVREYLGDKLHTQYYYMHPRSYNRRAVFSVDEPSATIRGVNRPIPETYKKHHADAADVADGGVRALTTKERSFIQTFPEDFVLLGNKTAVEQAIGNAVPVNLATYVAKAILEYMDEK
jgi:DNA (cytosine-5)-methyltransferase 1